MRAVAVVSFVGAVLAVTSFSSAQPPGGGKGEKKEKGEGKGDKGGFPGGKGFGPPPLGQVLPPFVQEQLGLTAAQKKDLDALQKDVDAKIEKLLTDQQRKLFKEMKERGPGRGPGGPGGPGGNPPPKKD